MPIIIKHVCDSCSFEMGDLKLKYKLLDLEGKREFIFCSKACVKKWCDV